MKKKKIWVALVLCGLAATGIWSCAKKTDPAASSSSLLPSSISVDL